MPLVGIGDSPKSANCDSPWQEVDHGRSYSMDLRRRVVARIAGGQSRRRAAQDLSVSPLFAVKLVARHARTGLLEPTPAQPGHVIARKLLATETSTKAMVGSNQPTRSTMNLSPPLERARRMPAPIQTTATDRPRLS